MGRKARAKQKKKQQEKRARSRNAQRRRDYASKNAEERRNAPVLKDIPRKRDKNNYATFVDKLLAGEREDEDYETEKATKPWPTPLWSPKPYISEEEKRKRHFEHIVKMSENIVLEVRQHTILGEIYQWRFDYEKPEDCKNIVYFLRSSSGNQFIAQVQGMSYPFAEGNYPKEVRDEKLYSESRRRAEDLATKFEKQFVDNTGRDKKPDKEKPKPEINMEKAMKKMEEKAKGMFESFKRSIGRFG